MHNGNGVTNSVVIEIWSHYRRASPCITGNNMTVLGSDDKSPTAGLAS
jgi:hypothetical protein